MEPPEPPDRDSSHSNQSLTNYSGKVSLGDHSITEKLSRPMAFDKVRCERNYSSNGIIL